MMRRVWLHQHVNGVCINFNNPHGKCEVCGQSFRQGCSVKMFQKAYIKD